MSTTATELCNPITLRVYWEDTDAGGVVFYANYLKFFERARTEWLRAMGLAQSTLQAEMDCIFVVAEVHLRYLAAARLDDLITVTAELIESGKASLQLQQQAWRADTLLAECRVRIGCVQASTLKPRRIPAQVGALLVMPDAATPGGAKGAVQTWPCLSPAPGIGSKRKALWAYNSEGFSGGGGAA